MRNVPQGLVGKVGHEVFDFTHPGGSGRRFARRVFVLAVFWLAPVSAGSAESLRGVALVIGNSAYEHLPALPNPATAKALTEALRGGFAAKKPTLIEVEAENFPGSPGEG